MTTNPATLLIDLGQNLIAKLKTRGGTRVFHGIASQVYFQAVTIFLQIIAIPILLHWWGVELFGVWLTLSALPTYLALADLGFANVGANEMTMKVAAEDRPGAKIVFDTVFLLVGAISVAILVLVSSAALFLPIASYFGIKNVDRLTIFWVLTLFSGQMVMALMLGVLGAGLRAERKIGLMFTLLATARLVEQLAVLVVAMCGGFMVMASVAMVVSRAVVTVLALILMVRIAPWLLHGKFAPDLKIFKRLFMPSITFMAYTAGNLINVQGVLLVVAAYLGPVAVATVAALRTVARVGTQCATMVAYALGQEYAAFFGAQRMDRFRKLFRYHVYVAAFLTVSYIVCALLFSHWVVDVWTHGRIKPVEPIFTLLIFASAGEMLWMTFQCPVTSINRHQFNATMFLLLSLAGLAATAVLSPTLGLNAAGLMQTAVALATMAISAGVAWNEFYKRKTL